MAESASPARAPDALGLKPREIQVLDLFAHGHSYVSAGERLHLSRSSVKDYAVSAYARLGANGAAHAIGICYRAGILPTGRAT